MKNPPYYSLPGMLSANQIAVTKEYGISFNTLFCGKTAPKVKARHVLYLLDFLKGDTQTAIAKRYGAPRSTVTHAIIRMKEELFYYKPFSVELGGICGGLGLSKEFNELYQSIMN